jgi:hypothetical protein
MTKEEESLSQTSAELSVFSVNLCGTKNLDHHRIFNLTFKTNVIPNDEGKGISMAQKP